MERSFPSPDGRFLVDFDVTEMRMSHWVERPILSEPAAKRTIFSLGETLWHADWVTWSPDSQLVTLSVRRYPGDAPSLILAVFPLTGKAEVLLGRNGPTIHTGISRELPGWLENWYRKNKNL